MAKAMRAAEDRISRDITKIMREETRELALEYRQQVRAAGMGSNLANTWRDRTYPLGDASLNPAGLVWSKSPMIINSYSRGVFIRPMNGAKWLWIPTKDGRRLVKASGKGRITSDDLQTLHRDELEIVIKDNKGYVFLNVVDGLTTGGLRRATRIRTQGRKGMTARQARRVLLFTLVRGVKVPRLFDIDTPARNAAKSIAHRVTARWG